VTGELQTITSTIEASHGQLSQATARIRGHFGQLFLRRGGVTTGELLTQLVADLLGPLRSALARCREELETSEATSVGSAPVSTVATTLVQQWPAGEDVPSRFATAQNEVLLEDIAGYPRSYADHLTQNFRGAASGGGAPTAERSEDLAVFEVLTWLHADSRTQLRTADRLSGLEPSTGAPTRVGRRSEWWPQALSSVSPSRAAAYHLDLDHVALLQGARAWVNRPNEVMGTFIGQGLDVYLNRPGAGPHEQEQTARRFVDRFTAALQLAAPLVAVEAGMVTATHGKEVRVGYTFTELPFGKSPEVVAMIAEALQREGTVDPETVTRMHQAVTQVTRNRIDILGNYSDIYSPIAFSSLQRPIRKQWSEASSAQLRSSFWTMRRGRSLVDFTPVSRSWLQALVTGWLIGRLTGEVLLPGEGPIVDGGIAVWSEELQQFTRLPHPLLGVEDPARDAPGWALLAAVVESMPLAIALCDGDTQFTALRPYQALFQLGRYLQNPQERQPNDALLPWVQKGLGRSGVPPRGEPAPVSTPEERLAEATAWCQELQPWVVRMLPRDPRFPGERGEFSEITAHNFWDVPGDWELAPQLVEATHQLLTNLALPEYLGAASGPGKTGIPVRM
jgi:hypothetical protein